MKRQKRHLNRVWFRSVKNVAALRVSKQGKHWIVFYDTIPHPTKKFSLQREAVAWTQRAFGIIPKKKAA